MRGGAILLAEKQEHYELLKQVTEILKAAEQKTDQLTEQLAQNSRIS